MSSRDVRSKGVASYGTGSHTDRRLLIYANKVKTSNSQSNCLLLLVLINLVYMKPIFRNPMLTPFDIADTDWPIDAAMAPDC